MSEMDLEQQSQQYKQGWEELYGSTKDNIWGTAPVGFLNEFLGYAAPHLASYGDRLKVLDAGTGEGRNLSTLLKLGGSLYACDASPSAIEKISPNVKSKLSATTCDLSNLPFENAFFHFVFLCDVFETILNPEDVLKEIHRVLEPGGIFLCNIPDMEEHIAGIDMVPLEDSGGFLYRNRYYYHFYPAQTAAEMIQAGGFEILARGAREWEEEAHPKYRPEKHTHRSQVFLARKVN